MWFFWNLLYPKTFWVESLRKNIFTPIGVHPFEKIGSKVVKIGKIPIFTPLPKFFLHHFLIWFVEQFFSKNTWIDGINRKTRRVRYWRIKNLKKKIQFFFYFFKKNFYFFPNFGLFLTNNCEKWILPLQLESLLNFLHKK